MFAFKYEPVEKDESRPWTEATVPMTENQNYVRPAATRRIMWMASGRLLLFAALFLVGVGVAKHQGLAHKPTLLNPQAFFPESKFIASDTS